MKWSKVRRRSSGEPLRESDGVPAGAAPTALALGSHLAWATARGEPGFTPAPPSCTATTAAAARAAAGRVEERRPTTQRFTSGALGGQRGSQLLDVVRLDPRLEEVRRHGEVGRVLLDAVEVEAGRTRRRTPPPRVRRAAGRQALDHCSARGAALRPPCASKEG